MSFLPVLLGAQMPPSDRQRPRQAGSAAAESATFSVRSFLFELAPFENMVLHGADVSGTNRVIRHMRIFRRVRAPADCHKIRGRAWVLHDELKALVTAGLTLYQASQTATVNAATFLGCSRTAGISSMLGKRADFVSLEQNPPNVISHLSAIAAVMVNGTWISKSSLRSLLRNARKQEDNE